MSTDRPDPRRGRIVDAVERELHAAGIDLADHPYNLAGAIIARVEAEAGSILPTLDEAEREAHDHLLKFMRIVVDDWELQTNREELAQAIHVLQGFVIGRMLHRLAPGHWSNWYAAAGEVGGRTVEPTGEPAALVRVTLLEPWLGLDRAMGSRNWAALSAADRDAVRDLTVDGHEPGDKVLLSQALAETLIGYGAAESAEPTGEPANTETKGEQA